MTFSAHAQALKPLLRSIHPPTPSHTLYRSTPHAPTPTLLRRASTMATKHEYLIIIPDKAGALEKRMQVRPQHLKELTPRVEDGFWTFGGAMLSQHLPADQTPSIKGSIMLATAASTEEVMEQLRKDVYAKEVWDLEKAEIIPFRTAIRKELK